jgi:protein-L-isoaspartate(D-aspartate) O-methyltransferase
MSREKDIQHMLEDIRIEVRMTTSYTGYAQFSDAVMAAMAAVPRHEFVPASMQLFAYANGPLAIGHGQTISQPYIVALMTQMLEVDKNAKVLEVGTGSGYQSAVLAQLVQQVFSMEVVKTLGLEATERLARLGYSNIDISIGDGYRGWPEHAPYDGIIVTAAAPYIPEPLIEQLKPGARLVIPVGTPFSGQELMLVEKGANGKVKERSVLPVAFVPLIHRLAD